MTEPTKLILVTGGAGFVGSHLCRALRDEGHRVISLDNYFTGLRTNHHHGIEYREGHTRDIKKHLTETPDIVFHLGEYARVERSFIDPTPLVWDLNIAGTFAVIEFCRQHACKLVYSGSSTKFADEGEGRRQSPYAWSKSSNTELIRNYGDWFGLSYAIAYFYSVYGEGEISIGPYATIVGIMKEAFKRQKPLPVVSPGTQKRGFTHIDDITRGLLLVAEQGSGDGYEIGSGEDYTILELAELFHSPITMLPERKGNRKNGTANLKKIKSLGWEPRVHLKDHIQDFLEKQNRPKS